MSTIKGPRALLDEAEASVLEPDIVVGVHYMLYGYVCGANCINPSPFDKPVTFTKIMTSRPDGCRFAVARRVPLLRGDPAPNKPLFTVGEPTGPFVVWDLHDEDLVRGRRTDGNGFMAPPPPWIRGPSEDGVTMKAMMGYADDRP